jgi:hypothetical protein
MVMTTWDYHTQPANRPPQVEDHRPLLEAAGFVVERYDDTEEWERRQRQTVDAMLDQVDALANESGRPVDDVRASIEDMAATFSCMIRRVLMIARRDDG